MTFRRWAIFIAGFVIVAGLLVWLAVPSVVTSVVESRLHAAGFANVTVTGAAFGSRGVDIRQLRLAPDDALVLDDVHLSMRLNEITGISIGRLSLSTELEADGIVALPGYVPATGRQGNVIDVLPEHGIRIERTEIRFATAAGETDAVLTNTIVRHDPADAGTVTAATDYSVEHEAATIEGIATASVADGEATEVRIAISDGSISVGGLQMDRIAGTLEASVRATAEPDTAADPPIEFELNLRSIGTPNAELIAGGRVRSTDDGPSIDLAGRTSLLAPVRGELEFALSGFSFGNDSIRGELQMAGRGFDIPGVLRTGSINAAARIEGNSDRLRLVAMTPWTVSFDVGDTVVPTPVQAAPGQPAAVTIASRTDEPLVLTYSRPDASVEIDAAVAVQVGPGSAEAAARIAVRWEPELIVTADELMLTAAGVSWDGFTLGLDGYSGQAVYRAAAWNVTGNGNLSATGSFGAVDVSGLTAQWSGSVSGTPADITATANTCVNWSVNRIGWRSMRVDDLSPPCLQPDQGDLLTYEIDSGRLRFAVSTEALPLQVQLEREAASDTISGRWPAVSLTGVIGGDNGLDLSAAIAGGAITIAEPNLEASGIDGAAEMRAGVWQTAGLQIATVASLVEPAWWAPVNVDASAERTGDGLAIEALISDTLGTFVVEATGLAERGRGTVEVQLYPIRFITGATEIADISPWLATTLTEAGGTVAFAGELAWGPDGLDSSGQLSLDRFGGTIAGVAVDGVSTEMQFASLWPLATLPAQRAAIARITLGLPLDNGAVVYDLDADGRVAIHSLVFETAGGRISSDPFTIDSGGQGDSQFSVRVDDIELSQMLELSKINGLQGTGVLSGTIPVRISGRNVYLDDGQLVADVDGSLRYTPASPPAFLRGDDQRTQMLREALTNFQYDQLSVNLSGESGEGGQQTVIFNALGANPDFLDGHPIDLTFTFQGPLLGAMSSAVSVAGAAEIQDLFEQQQSNPQENTQ